MRWKRKRPEDEQPEPQNPATPKPRHADLHHEIAPDGSTRSVWLAESTSGSLSIAGQDLGDLSRFFGEGTREYEWDYSVGAADVPKLAAALGGGPDSDAFELVRERFAGERHGEFRDFCIEHAITPEFWSRFGE